MGVGVCMCGCVCVWVCGCVSGYMCVVCVCLVGLICTLSTIYIDHQHSVNTVYREMFVAKNLFCRCDMHCVLLHRSFTLHLFSCELAYILLMICTVVK